MRVRTQKHGVHGEARETALTVRLARRFLRFGKIRVQLIDCIFENRSFYLWSNDNANINIYKYEIYKIRCTKALDMMTDIHTLFSSPCGKLVVNLTAVPSE